MSKSDIPGSQDYDDGFKITYINGDPVVYCDREAAGALKNGTRVEKIASETGDTHLDGAVGRIIGSIATHFDGYPDRYIYWVMWDDAPGVPFGVREHRIRVGLRADEE